MAPSLADAKLARDWPAFVAAVAASPEDDTPRLALADRLEEAGYDARAQLIRRQCEYEVAWASLGLPEDARDCFDMYLDPEDWPQQDAKHRMEVPRRAAEKHLKAFGEQWAMEEFVRPANITAGAADRTPGANGIYDRWTRAVGQIQTPRTRDAATVWRWKWRRGFIESVTTTWSEFVWTNFDAALNCSPIQEVVITDPIPMGVYFDQRISHDPPNATTRTHFIAGSAAHGRPSRQIVRTPSDEPLPLSGANFSAARTRPPALEVVELRVIEFPHLASHGSPPTDWSVHAQDALAASEAEFACREILKKRFPTVKFTLFGTPRVLVTREVR